MFQMVRVGGAHSARPGSHFETVASHITEVVAVHCLATEEAEVEQKTAI